MENFRKIGLTVLSFAGAVFLFTQSASAHGFDGGMGFGFGKGHFINKEIREEIKNKMKAEHDALKSMTKEERMQKLEEMWQERESWREDREKAWTDFTGLTREQVEEKRESGQTMGQILEAQGKTAAQTQTFLESQGNRRVEIFAAKWNLAAETVTRMKENAVEWAKRLVSKWFGN